MIVKRMYPSRNQSKDPYQGVTKDPVGDGPCAVPYCWRHGLDQAVKTLLSKFSPESGRREARLEGDNYRTGR